MITWYYNHMGDVAIWNKEIDNPSNKLDSDLYLQNDTDVESFFDHIGLKMDEVCGGDWDTCEDIGYFID